MESWTDTPSEPFKVKVFLDTNVLNYLVDNTYQGLNDNIIFLKDLDFVDLISSMFVIYEFVGVRKKEHYLKKVLATGKANISSLLKYSNSYSAPELGGDEGFNNIKEELKEGVKRDLDEIINSFGINFEDNLLHNDLLKPTFELFLTTKLSKEDSLVLLSSIFPEQGKKEKAVIFLSNDTQFVTIYKNQAPQDVNDFCKKFDIHSPEVHLINNINLKASSGNTINLTRETRNFKSFWKKKVLNSILEKNKNIFLGYTFPPNNNKFPKDIICFKLKENIELKSDIYITIIGKNLDFIYTTRTSIKEFWHNGKIQDYPFVSTQKENISFKLIDDEQSIDISKIVSKIREDSNLVFFQEF